MLWQAVFKVEFWHFGDLARLNLVEEECGTVILHYVLKSQNNGLNDKVDFGQCVFFGKNFSLLKATRIVNFENCRQKCFFPCIWCLYFISANANRAINYKEPGDIESMPASISKSSG